MAASELINERIKLCRYYKGEKKNPYNATGMHHTYWEIEYMWVNQVMDDHTLMNEYLSNFAFDFPDLMSFISTPLSLKAFMYDQFYHFGGKKDGFENWLYSYLESFPGDTKKSKKRL